MHCLILRGRRGAAVRCWSKQTRLNGSDFVDEWLRPGDRLTIGNVELEFVSETKSTHTVDTGSGGHTPTIVVLTDGKANVDRQGQPGRERAEEDARISAARIQADGVGALVIDVSARPQEKASRLASAMGARYIALPRADSHALSTAVRSAAPGDGAG